MDIPFVELKGINKKFGTVVANQNVNMTINKGEIHAILGENGSGKSTLMNMLSGIYMPDSGQILLEGRELKITSPDDAINAGIGMIHQHFKLVDVFSAKENITLGKKDGLFIKGKELSRQIREVGDKYSLRIDPDKKVYNMSVSEKQTVEIIKVLFGGARLLILDEPTAVLTPQEIDNLFSILRKMRDDGCAIIIITHKMDEVMSISDHITILRKGESIATVNTADTDVKSLTEMMVGRPISLEIKRVTTDPEKVKPILNVRDLVVEGVGNQRLLDNVSFELSSGEILGVAGIAGSGQKELCEVLAGICRPKTGSAIFKGDEIIGLSPREIIRKGIKTSFIPEDRLGMGLVGNMNIIDNVLLKEYHNSNKMFMSRKGSKQISEQIIEKYDIKTPSVYHQVKKLSGGNIQKVLLGREINLAPQLLVTAYPVRGLDIGASYQIYNLLNSQKQDGVGIIFIGEDLDVLMALCDRIMVLSHGEVMDIVPADKVTKEQLGMLMLGHKNFDTEGHND